MKCDLRGGTLDFFINALNNCNEKFYFRGFLFIKKLVFVLLILSTSVIVFPVSTRAESQDITLNIDGTQIQTFSALIERAEYLVMQAIAQRFQTNPSLAELHITVLGERNGQLVSLLSSRISRETWESGVNIRSWTRYLSSSSALLGYRNSEPTLTRVAQNQPFSSDRLIATINTDPRLDVEQALSLGQITNSEYWDLMDTLD
jgi:hypothetical protein